MTLQGRLIYSQVQSPVLRATHCWNSSIKQMVRKKGFEPLTSTVAASCSAKLNYLRNVYVSRC